ncbi:MAG TPA: hypothetical protein VFI27_06285 [candidate division Zixibacteria bacterium]|jgi:hypothetical protein|nr:hypothetical protein [candidate division Zixibacteria bacterium]
MRDLQPENKSVYEKPAIIHRELMESIAGTCDSSDPVNGKTGTDDNCTFLSS